MQVVTTAQVKGGVGKTTTTLLLASAALADGKTVTIVDGDGNEQISRWRYHFENADWGVVPKPAWPETSLKIVKPPKTIGAYYDLLNAEEASGRDLFLVDARPGTHEDVEQFILASDLVLIPARPLDGEREETRDALSWMNKLRETLADPQDFPNVRVILSQVGPQLVKLALGQDSNASKRDTEIMGELLNYPCLGVLVPDSKIWSQIRSWGPLGLAVAAHQSKSKALANAMEFQMRVASAVLEEVMELAQ